MMFLPLGDKRRAEAAALAEKICADEGWDFLGWREVPVDADCLGDLARRVMPHIMQFFVRKKGLSGNDLERQLYVLRKCLENAGSEKGYELEEFYLSSLSGRTIVYKGMFVAPQFLTFYPDLLDEDTPPAETATVVGHEMGHVADPDLKPDREKDGTENTEAQEKQKRGEWDKRLQQSRSDNQVAIAQILADAEVYARTKRADADATHATLLAEGNLGIAEAEALRDSLRNAALDSTGGRILLARQAAENLQIDAVTLNSNDPAVPTVIDIDALVRLLVGNGPAAPEAPDR